MKRTHKRSSRPSQCCLSVHLCTVLGWQTSLPMTGLLQVLPRRKKKPKPLGPRENLWEEGESQSLWEEKKRRGQITVHMFLLTDLSTVNMLVQERMKSATPMKRPGFLSKCLAIQTKAWKPTNSTVQHCQAMRLLLNLWMVAYEVEKMSQCTCPWMDTCAGSVQAQCQSVRMWSFLTSRLELWGLQPGQNWCASTSEKLSGNSSVSGKL